MKVLIEIDTDDDVDPRLFKDRIKPAVSSLVPGSKVVVYTIEEKKVKV